MSRAPEEIETIEVKILTDALRMCSGFDFRSYDQGFIKDQIIAYRDSLDFKYISELIPMFLHDPYVRSKLIKNLTIPVTEMFRDPEVYRILRDKIIPLIDKYPLINIWHAGCATGEEVYSMAIMLKEAGIYHKVRIYATDIDEEALKTAKEGIYPANNVAKNTSNYNQFNGYNNTSSDNNTNNNDVRNLQDYFTHKYEFIKMKNSLRENIFFFNHDLVTDQLFARMHLILCRNVIIYFNQQLKDRVLHLFLKSLVNEGFLCIGNSETLQFSSVWQHFTAFADKERIYRKRIPENLD